VDKKLIDIYNQIQNSAEDFYNHLNKLLPSRVLELVDKLMSKTDVYLFSGIIRDYFIKSDNNFRDIDFIVDNEIDIEAFISNLDVTKNSFGGYKIIMDSVMIDIWNIKNTWGIQNQSLLPFVDKLPGTTFFNSSSILFSLKNKQFIVGKPFLNFLKEKKLDIVLKENPEPALCIVKSFYYSRKYDLKISENLIDYITMNYDLYVDRFESIQEKHFKKIIYTKKELLQYIAPYITPNTGFSKLTHRANI
jgi:hypothetical protein